jgi:adenylate kinase
VNLLIMGPPGAGKGTQAGGIAEHYKVPAISTGQLFRDNIALGTALGADRGLIAAGNLVPDEVTNEMVFDRLAKPDVRKHRGFLLDGYPRTLEQAAALDAELQRLRNALDGVIALTPTPASLVSRMLKRAEIEGRADDNEETIRTRIEVYGAETAPLLTLYGERGLLIDVDADGTVDEVAQRIRSALSRGSTDGEVRGRGAEDSRAAHRDAARRVGRRQTHVALREAAAPGVTTGELDVLAARCSPATAPRRRSWATTVATMIRPSRP